jgi:large subunit ribosomal protein L24
MKLRKGDTAQIMVGKDSGRKGKILKVSIDSNKVVLEGLNLFKKNKKPRRQGEKGAIITIARPISASNVMLFCNHCDKPVRAGFKFEGARKIRICKKCQNNL